MCESVYFFTAELVVLFFVARSFGGALSFSKEMNKVGRLIFASFSLSFAVFFLF